MTTLEGYYMVCPDCMGRYFLSKNRTVAFIMALWFWYVGPPDAYSNLHDGHQSPDVLYMEKEAQG